MQRFQRVQQKVFIFILYDLVAGVEMLFKECFRHFFDWPHLLFKYVHIYIHTYQMYILKVRYGMSSGFCTKIWVFIYLYIHFWNY